MRFALAIVVGLLVFSASGLSGLVVDEPCTGYEQSDSADSACPPTCVTCGCCAQGVETLTLAVSSAPDTPSPDMAAALRDMPNAHPHDILHVPKPVLS